MSPRCPPAGRSEWWATSEADAPIRIAVVHSFYSSAQPSGENGAVEDQVDALSRDGHEVALFSTSTDQRGHETGYRLRAAGRVATGYGHHPRQAVEAFGPDVVHVHNLFPNFGRRWVRTLNVPVVATLHNYRPLCAQVSLYRDGGLCTRCPDGDRWAGVRYGCYGGSRLASLPIAWANRKGLAADPLLARADRITVPSAQAHAVYKAAGLSAQKLITLPNFLPDARDPGPGPGDGGEQRWLFVGRLDEGKGAVELVERWPTARPLIIVGAGGDEARVRRAARGKRVELLGHVTKERVLDLMGRATGLLYPSRHAETFGLPYIEALAAGTPTLALAPNTVAELVAAEGTGAVAGWGDDLDAVLADAAATFSGLRRACRGVFETRYTEAVHLDRVRALYRAVLAERTAV